MAWHAVCTYHRQQLNTCFLTNLHCCCYLDVVPSFTTRHAAQLQDGFIEQFKNGYKGLLINYEDNLNR
jgi:hypothetical protein